ncbi:uncharacterized protein ATC70_005955 [Mucor velutinosus]|uniref:Uncharacterized protein n=1 Tax=Mucor velutinosus TaxID=708070 RepID=A0AAN7DAX1_9FUNG|nr:hypothetical protein ATC70_005955 [Mucor velutinosus]
MSSCSKLLHELLQCIVRHVNSNSEAPNTKDLKAFQLVCKSWSKPAQEVLYQHVKLAAHARSFATTITKAPHVGLFVQKVVFLENFDTNKRHLDEILQAIVQYCVNVKQIHSCFLHQTSDMVEFLLSEGNSIKGLEKLKTENHWRRVDPVDYEAVALRYRNTMKQLHLTHECLDKETTRFIEYRELEYKLYLFLALQQLDIAKYLFEDVNKMDHMLNSCSPSLSELFVEEWWSTTGIVVPPQDTITPNTTITKLRIKSARTTPETMHHFAIKFKALKELDARFNTGSESIEAIAAWWRHLTSISLALTRYTYGIQLSYFRQEPGVDQLIRCLDIVQKTAPTTCSRHFKLKYCYEACYESDMNSILMSWTPSSYDVATDQRYSTDFRLSDLVRSLQQLYSPDSIQLLFKNLDNVYEALAYTGDADSNPSDDDCAYLSGLSYDFVPAQKIKKRS